MNTNYFSNCRSLEDVKTTFKTLAKQLHPDCGGNAELFKQMMTAYRETFERLKNIHSDSEGKTYQKESAEKPEQYAEIINQVIFFENVTIEIIGSWIWLSGDTYPCKDQLKEIGFHYSSSKKAWYYNGKSDKSFRRGRYSMTKLREKWGSQTVQNQQRAMLAQAI